MFQFIINTLAICTFFLAWSLFCIAIFSFIWQWCRSKALGIIGDKKVFTLGLLSLVLCNLLISLPILNILLNVLIALCSGHIFHLSLLHQLIKRKAGFYFFPNYKYHPGTAEKEDLDLEKIKEVGVEENRDEEVSVIFSEEKANQIHRILDSPAFLYNPDISLNLLARKAAVNTTYLSRYFNRQLGVSFPEYITDRRLDKAEELLRETDMRVLDIFEQVGFQNSSTFYQVFNERHQLSPLQWRESLRCD